MAKVISIQYVPAKSFTPRKKNDGAVTPQITLKAANNSGKSHNGTEQEPITWTRLWASGQR